MDHPLFMEATSAAGAVAWVIPYALNPTDPPPTQAFGAPPAGLPFVLNPSLSGISQADRQILFASQPASAAGERATQQAAIYPQSVASGDPRANGIVLWTRVDPAHQRAPSADLAENLLAWQIASDPAFAPASILIEGVARITPDKDGTVKLSIAHNILKPFTQYHYRFLYNGIASRTGHFKTLPAPTDSLAQLKLGYVVCQDYGSGFYNALTYLAEEQVDFVVHLGDYIYETIHAGSFQRNPVRVVPPFASGGSVPQNVDDYRHLYKIYRSDPSQQAVHENFAYILLWDDHEFANDCHQDFHPDDDAGNVTATTPQPALRLAANQAWSEYGLANTPFDASQGWENSIQVYRTFSFGTLAELIVTDERLYRDAPPCGSKEIGQRYFSLGCTAMHDPARSMLGATQHAWFTNQLKTTQATWKLWANEVMLMQLKFGPLFIDLDQWDGYQQERNAILNVVKHAAIKNFVALTGDLHSFLAGYLKTDFDNPFEPHVGIELMVGSITSANFAEEIHATLPLPSRPIPAKHMGILPAVLSDTLRATNPWIEFFNSSTHGYGIVTLTPQQLVCQFKAVSTITQPAATLIPLATFTIPVNQVKLIKS